MSSPSPERRAEAYLNDMVEFCRYIGQYTGACTYESWIGERMRYDATLRNLELLGEAATHVPQDIRALAPDIPWRMIIATRNRLAHAYLGIEAETVWIIVRERVPALQAALLTLLTSLNSP